MERRVRVVEGGWSAVVDGTAARALARELEVLAQEGDEDAGALERCGRVLWRGPAGDAYAAALTGVVRQVRSGSPALREAARRLRVHAARAEERAEQLRREQVLLAAAGPAATATTGVAATAAEVLAAAARAVR